MYNCKHPRRIYNNHLCKHIFVTCGCCEACRNKRSYELKSRCEREHLSHRFCFLVTLDYRNEDLPVYTSVGKGFDWLSNREDYDNVPSENIKYKPIPDEDVDFYSRPVRYRGDKRVFAHLCIEDVQIYLDRVRNDFKYYCKKYKKDYHAYKIRYFLCAEYGPTTYRPHYHLLIWFDNRDGLDLLRQSLSKSWTLGTARIDPVTTSGVSNYVASYVSSFANLPRVLSFKPIRPRCTFSQSPVLGLVNLTGAEIQNFLFTGASGRVEYDNTKKSFIDYVFPHSVYNRYFPKCQGFSYKTFFDKLRIYRYVFAYFKRKGYKHDIATIDDVRLKDIEFPTFKPQIINHLTGEILLESGYDEDLEKWSYQDKYASLVAYKYYVKYGIKPEEVLVGIEKVYNKCEQSQLSKFYDYQENIVINRPDELKFTLNHDLEFLLNLPRESSDLTLNQLSVLSSYGIPLADMYPLGALSYDYLDSISYDNDPNYQQFCAEQEKYFGDKVKRKKMNDYKQSLNFKLVKNE